MDTNATRKIEPKLIYISSKGLLFQGDSGLLLKDIRSDSIDLVFADPPFNLGKDYKTDSFSDLVAVETYRLWCHLWILELIRVLRPGGSLFLYHLPKWLMDLGSWMNTLPWLEFRNWIAVKMKSGFPIRGRLHPAHYGILYFTKRGADLTFHVVRSKTPICRHCNREIRDYGGYREKYKKYEDEDGVPWIQVSDFWEDTRPASQDKTRDIRIMELPLHIPERLILMASNPGDTVLDIFGGAGSTYHAAQLNGRRWIGCEIGDVSPVLSRIKTFFGLEKRSRISRDLSTHFQADFIKKQVADYVRDHRTDEFDQISPQKITKSMQRYVSKSRVLD